MHLASIDELKYLKNSDGVIQKIKEIKQFVKKLNCSIIEPQAHTTHIDINDNELVFEIRISIPLSLKK